MTFNVIEMVTLKKHLNNKHTQSSSYEKELVDTENVSQFISILGLEKYFREFKRFHIDTVLALLKQEVLCSSCDFIA